MERALIRAKTERQERDNGTALSNVWQCSSVGLCSDVFPLSPTCFFSHNMPQEQVNTVMGHVTGHRSSSPSILTSFPQFNNPGIRSLRNHFVTLGMTVHDFRRLRFGQDSCTFLITSYRMLL